MIIYIYSMMMMERVIEDRYTVNDRIGNGEYGTVFKAICKQTDEPVAIKFVSRDNLLNVDGMDRQIRIEIEAMMLINNPNVVKLKDYFENSKGIYVVMEYCEGGTLTELVEKEKGLGEDRSIEYLRQLVSGYTALLAKNIIHRDIKADNLLLKGDRIVIADFGFAKILGDESTTSSAIGTPLTVAPEVIIGKNRKYTSKCDIWSLGCVFYYMIFGQYHCDLPTVKHIVYHNLSSTGDKLVLPAYPPISPLTEELIREMLQAVPSNRIDWSGLIGHPIVTDVGEGGISNQHYLQSNYLWNRGRIDNLSYHHSQYSRLFLAESVANPLYEIDEDSYPAEHISSKKNENLLVTRSTHIPTSSSFHSTYAYKGNISNEYIYNQEIEN